MKKKKVSYSSFQAADYLNNEKVIAEYLSAAAQDENSDVPLKALSDVAKARGMAQVAKDSGLGHESLYKALSPSANQRYETVASVMRALKVKIEVGVERVMWSVTEIGEDRGRGGASYVECHRNQSRIPIPIG